MFSPWSLAYMLLLVECLFVMLMIMPVPSNHVRYLVVVLCRKLSSSPRARITQQVLLGITLLLFLDAMRTINMIAENHEVGEKRETHEKMSLFVNQRNAFITGFILFLAVVIYRLQHITVDLYELRKERKERAAQSGSTKKSD